MRRYLDGIKSAPPGEIERAARRVIRWEAASVVLVGDLEAIRKEISEILEMLVEISGLSVEVVFDPSLRRPSDEPLLLGDNTRLKALGWQPHHTIKQTLETIFQDWLCRI
jgi:nucleoside-diphosphate-sugar epimerase